MHTKDLQSLNDENVMENQLHLKCSGNTNDFKLQSQCRFL